MYLIISKELYWQMVYQRPKVQYETGGFIGVESGCVRKYIYDEGIEQNSMYTYRPSVQRLNEALANWEADNIKIYGILHTHLNHSATLSAVDIMFIRAIFKSNMQINEMFFPVVLPGKSLNLYYAKRCLDDIEISEAAIKII